jgi:hypothetical protein
VHWVSAAQPDGIAIEIAACGAQMGLPNWPEKQPEQVALTLRAWQAQPLRLVVLDNLEEPALLQDWLPRLGGVRLLVTSRQQRWPTDLVQALGVEALPRPASLSLLRALAAFERYPGCGFEPLGRAPGRPAPGARPGRRYLDDRSGLSAAACLKELEQAGGALAHTSQQD